MSSDKRGTDCPTCGALVFVEIAERKGIVGIFASCDCYRDAGWRGQEAADAYMTALEEQVRTEVA